jgi:mono/diheme cytochrome c family protein/uncharacterized membrane protein
MNLIDSLLPGVAESPNIHPMLVHFPAALLPVAFVLAALAWWRYPQLWLSARLVLVFGVLGSLAAGATGLIAQESMPHGPGSLVATHRTFMLVSIGLAISAALLMLSRRLVASRRHQMLALGALGILNGVVVLGADRGALVSLRLREGAPRGADGAPAETAANTKANQGTQGDHDPTTPILPLPAGNAERGRDLWGVLECAGCHGAPEKQEGPGIPPTLEHAGSILQPAWVASYLMKPHRIRWIDENKRPIQRMPDFHLAPDEAADLAAFLAARVSPEKFPTEPVAKPFTAEEVDEGRGLYDQYACKNCHRLDGKGTDFGPPLDGAGDRLEPAFLYALLMKPKAVIPRTPMKDFGLWEEEARSLTAYVSSLRAIPARVSNDTRTPADSSSTAQLR